MTTPEFQFIQFSDQLIDIGYSIKVGYTGQYTSNQIMYHISETDFKLAITNRFGKIIKQSGDSFSTNLLNTGWFEVPLPLSDILSYQEEFRLAVLKDDKVYYSNLLQLDDSKYGKVFKYSDPYNTYAPYNSTDINIYLSNNYNNDRIDYASVRLNANIIGNADKSEKEEYVDNNGKIFRPYNLIRNEIEIEFDFMPEWMHDRIRIMLHHPILYIDGVSYILTSEYEVNYENKLSYEIDYMKAKCKLAKLNPIIFKN